MTLAMIAMCPAVAAGTVAGMGMAASCNTGWSMLAAATAMAAGISSIDAGIWREIYKVTDTLYLQASTYTLWQLVHSYILLLAISYDLRN